MEQQVTPCIIHEGKKTPFGHGYIGRLFAHRVVWAQHNGTIPKGMCIRHTCDNPSCINPEHLVLGTKKQNSEDMVKRGRCKAPKGEASGNAKLTNEAVEYIRKKYVPRHRLFGTRGLARQLGVAHTVIGKAISGRTWKHVI